MQHQFWITKQTLSRKFGRKEDECIISSDAELDSKLELFHNIQVSCANIQRIIDKYQEAICYLSQETNSMGRFLKENSDEDKTRAGEMMLATGKALVYCAQQQLLLHEPLIRFYKELETFRQRAVGDTLQNVLAMEKARTEYRASLSWMKNVSQQLNPDTTKQLEKFKKVQDQVRRGKSTFDKLAFDCLQKVDLLAAARCNMLNHSLSFYQTKQLNYTGKSAKTYSLVLKSFGKKQQAEGAADDARAELSTTDEVGDSCKDKKNVSNENLLMDENGASLIDNDADGSRHESVPNDWQVPKLSLQSQTQDLILETDNILNEISLEEARNAEMAKTDWNLEGKDSFLPSALLKQGLKSATSTSKKGKTNFSTDKDSAETKKNQEAKSWLNLFQDLDPLSNNAIEKSTKHKNSFV